MRYVLADEEMAILAGFDVITHNVIDIKGESKMVITEKGMNVQLKRFCIWDWLRALLSVF